MSISKLVLYGVIGLFISVLGIQILYAEPIFIQRNQIGKITMTGTHTTSVNEVGVVFQSLDNHLYRFPKFRGDNNVRNGNALVQLLKQCTRVIIHNPQGTTMVDFTNYSFEF